MRKIHKIFCGTILIFFVSVPVYGDTVKKVYACGSGVGIELATNGWLVIQEATVGTEQVNRILTLALVLLSTGNQVGYYNAQASVHWCGIDNVKPITVLQITNQ